MNRSKGNGLEWGQYKHLECITRISMPYPRTESLRTNLVLEDFKMYLMIDIRLKLDRKIRTHISPSQRSATVLYSPNASWTNDVPRINLACKCGSKQSISECAYAVFKRHVLWNAGKMTCCTNKWAKKHRIFFSFNLILHTGEPYRWLLLRSIPPCKIGVLGWQYPAPVTASLFWHLYVYIFFYAYD